MSGLYGEAFIEQLRRGAAALAPQWGLSPRTSVSLLNISENATFRADDPERPRPLILRVHRPGYHTRREIESELAWIDSLAAAEVAPLARALETRGGGKIAEFACGDDVRQVVAFEFLDGVEPSPDHDLPNGFEQLGAITARLHRHAAQWRRPPWFTRKIWDVDATIGSRAPWGDWRAGLGLTGTGAAVLERAAAALRQRLSAYGAGPDRFGLIHADLRLANLLVRDGEIAVIDFDDCGFSWFAFDFAAAVSFIETDPLLPALRDAWLAGYRRVAPFSPEAEAMLPSFVLLRRMQLTAWIASHAETPTAQALGAPFTEGAVALAEAFLRDALLA